MFDSNDRKSSFLLPPPLLDPQNTRPGECAFRLDVGFADPLVQPPEHLVVPFGAVLRIQDLQESSLSLAHKDASIGPTQ